MARVKFDPYNRLYGATATPIRLIAKDPLSDMAHTVAVYSALRAPPRWRRWIDRNAQEQLDALPALKRGPRITDGLHIASIERLRRSR